MSHHELKIHPEPFAAVKRGDKRHEVRKNDRHFEVGDLLELREWDPGLAAEVGSERAYTGQRVFARVTYITAAGNFGLPDDLVVMSIDSLL